MGRMNWQRSQSSARRIRVYERGGVRPLERPWSTMRISHDGGKTWSDVTYEEWISNPSRPPCNH